MHHYSDWRDDATVEILIVVGAPSEGVSETNICEAATIEIGCDDIGSDGCEGKLDYRKRMLLRKLEV